MAWDGGKVARRVIVASERWADCRAAGSGGDGSVQCLFLNDLVEGDERAVNSKHSVVIC